MLLRMRWVCGAPSGLLLVNSSVAMGQGAQGVDRDAVAAQFHGQCARQADQARLGRRVDDAVRLAQRGARGHVHDAPFAAGAQRGQEGLHQQHGRAQVQSHHVVEMLGAGVVDGAGARGTRVVDQGHHVVRGGNAGRRLGGGLLAGQVGLVAHQQGMAPIGQHVVEVDHGAALSQQGLGDGAADAVAGAADHGDGCLVIHGAHRSLRPFPGSRQCPGPRRCTWCTARSGRPACAAGSRPWWPGGHRRHPADGPAQWRRPIG